MTGLVLWMAFAATATSDQPVSYQVAYETANKTKKPMLILVGADWCPACRVMKQSTLPQLQKSGKLDGVAYTVVDVDASPGLGSKLMRSTTIPQLIFCAPLTKGWKRTYLHGNQAPEQILELIRTGLDEQHRDLVAHEKSSTATDQTADE